MDVLAVRGALSSALSAHLGTYTLANGSTTPALAVRSPGEGTPAGTSVSGLEVVISSVPELEQQLQYTLSPFVQVWLVYLLDWGGGDLEDATAVVQDLLPNTTATILAVTEQTGPLRQSLLRIPLSREGLLSISTVRSVNGLNGNVELGLLDLVDVDNTGLQDDSVLVWDVASGKWVVNAHTTLTLTDGGSF